MTQAPSQDPTSRDHYTGIRFSTYKFGGDQVVGTNIQIIAISKISLGGLKIEAIVRTGDSIIEDKSLKKLK